MKKVKRLIEIKRQLKLANAKIIRISKVREKLGTERQEILDSLTAEDVRLYKEQIERACKL